MLIDLTKFFTKFEFYFSTKIKHYLNYGLMKEKLACITPKRLNKMGLKIFYFY